MGWQIPPEKVSLAKSRFRGFYCPDGLVPTLETFQKICQREGTSMSEKILGFISNYVRIHEPGNPQWTMERFSERSQETTEVPAPEKPMPDYQHMTDQELLQLYTHPWKASHGDRMIIRHILDHRKVKVPAAHRIEQAF